MRKPSASESSASESTALNSGLAEFVGVSSRSVEDLLQALGAKGLTVATAESLTGGLLAAVLTEIPGSSSVVRGGLVVYATDLKHRLADVDPILLAERGPVDLHVADRLAQGARRRCRADIGVGLTGVAGPEPLNGVAVGTWFCAVAGPDQHRDSRQGRPGHLHPRPVGIGQSAAAGRRSVRAAAVRAALTMLANIAATDS